MKEIKEVKDKTPSTLPKQPRHIMGLVKNWLPQRPPPHKHSKAINAKEGSQGRKDGGRKSRKVVKERRKEGSQGEKVRKELN